MRSRNHSRVDKKNIKHARDDLNPDAGSDPTVASFQVLNPDLNADWVRLDRSGPRLYHATIAGNIIRPSIY